MNRFGSKYSDVLTMILVVVIVVILGIVGYFGYDVYKQNTKNANAQAALAEFEEATKPAKKKVNKVKDENTVSTNTLTGEELQEALNQSIQDQQSVEQPEEEVNEEPKKVMYEGYEMKGKISIPKTGCEYPILSEVTKRSLEVAVAILYGPGLNEPGNTVIVGHNYRNGMFFSNNSKLAIGDLIYITSATETVTYEIYNIYQTSPDEASYMKRDTGGAREISLSTCTNDSSQRLIIWAKEK